MKELEDYSWFPVVLRNFQTEFIGFVVAKFNVYDSFIRYLNTLSLAKLSMTDICSGSGEPAVTIFRKSSCFSHLSLSDKYPNPLKFREPNITYENIKTDVLEMKFIKGTYYTMFNAFHHFEDEEKLRIIQKIQDSGSAAFIVEVLEPTIFCFLKIFFTTTIGSLLLTPFIFPLSLSRLFFTYIIPINIFAITFDGILSVLNSRSVKQYQALFAHNSNAIKVFRLQKRLFTLIVIQIESDK